MCGLFTSEISNDPVSMGLSGSNAMSFYFVRYSVNLKKGRVGFQQEVHDPRLLWDHHISVL